MWTSKNFSANPNIFANKFQKYDKGEIFLFSAHSAVVCLLQLECWWRWLQWWQKCPGREEGRGGWRQWPPWFSAGTAERHSHTGQRLSGIQWRRCLVYPFVEREKELKKWKWKIIETYVVACQSLENSGNWLGIIQEDVALEERALHHACQYECMVIFGVYIITWQMLMKSGISNSL